jgi:ssRNA-specific RNase YbeY (16S rRNA maturation enzyme)
LHLIGYEDSDQELKAVMTGLEDLYLGMAREEAV